MIETQIYRYPSTNKTTLGEWWMDDNFFCYTLEDVVREKKIPKITAIPAGRYEIKITKSPKFKQDMPILLNVPGYEGIRVHWGSNSSNTDGCIIVGDETTEDEKILNSKQTYKLFFSKLKKMLKKDRVFVTIENG